MLITWWRLRRRNSSFSTTFTPPSGILHTPSNRFHVIHIIVDRPSYSYSGVLPATTQPVSGTKYRAVHVVWRFIFSIASSLTFCMLFVTWLSSLLDTSITSLLTLHYITKFTVPSLQINRMTMHNYLSFLLTYTRVNYQDDGVLLLLSVLGETCSIQTQNYNDAAHGHNVMSLWYVRTYLRAWLSMSAAPLSLSLCISRRFHSTFSTTVDTETLH